MDFFDKVKNGVDHIKNSKGIPVPITSNMLKEVLKRNEKVHDVTVSITKGEFIVTGKAKADLKLTKKDLPFSISLVPVKIEGRQLIFKIAKLKPLNLNILNKRIFDKPPHVKYSSGHIQIDFNSWDIVKMIPVGKITSYEMEDGRITIMVGV